MACTEGFRDTLRNMSGGNIISVSYTHLISVKNDKITGRVLAVSEKGIEIEGYGLLELDKNFKVHRVYGQYSECKLSDILVGYDNQEFVTSNGKLCAALITREFDAEKIRVLLMNTGFQSVFHPSVTLTWDTGRCV